jgi:uncharacterized protein
MTPELIRGETFHGRRGDLTHAFRYSVDCVLIEPESLTRGPALFGRFGLFKVRDKDHGGPPGQGGGAAGLRAALTARCLADITAGRLLLLTQPRVLGHVFNPVSFWLCHDRAGDLRVVVAEVTNTYGDRHSYLCVKPDRSRITAKDDLTAEKMMHVSPFQPLNGGYTFRFDITSGQVTIRIDYQSAEGPGLLATLTGPRLPLTNRAILWSCLRRPFGSRRVLALIHWQALKLWKKGAPFRKRPHYDGPGVS